LGGGLKVVPTRGLGHASLAEGRLRALGGVPSVRVGRELASLLAMLASPEVSDRAKLAALLARFPGGLEDPLAAVVRRIERDDETRSLLETIADDERTTLAWRRRMSDTLEHEQALPARPGRAWCCASSTICAPPKPRGRRWST